MELRVAEAIILNGRHHLCAWKPGEIARLLRDGRSLPEAKIIAARRRFLVDELRMNNIVVAIGKNLAAKWAIDSEAVGVTYYAIGTGITPPAAGDTQLGTEVERKLFATRTTTGGVATFSAYFPKADCTYFIKEVGAFGGASASLTANSGILTSHAALNYDNSAGAVDLTFDLDLTFA